MVTWCPRYLAPALALVALGALGCGGGGGEGGALRAAEGSRELLRERTASPNAPSTPALPGDIAEPGAPQPAGSLPGDPPDCAGPPYPIILQHGFSGFAHIGPINYFFRVADDLRARGALVVEAEVAPYQASYVRGPQLATIVDQTRDQTRACKVNIIAHSQGGIDVRYLIGSLGYGDRVAAVVTVATPHRGTAVADLVLGPRALWPSGFANLISLLIGRTISSVGDDPDLLAQIDDLTEAHMQGAFAAENPDDPRVAFFSVAGRSDLMRGDEDCAGGLWPNPRGVDAIDPALWPTARFLRGLGLRPVVNDGLVTVRSARWGRFLGCIPADHFGEVGQIARLGPDLLSGFDHLAYYRRVVELLRSEDF